MPRWTGAFRAVRVASSFAVAGSRLDGSGEVDRGGGQGQQVADDGGDIGTGVHLYGIRSLVSPGRAAPC